VKKISGHNENTELKSYPGKKYIRSLDCPFKRRRFRNTDIVDELQVRKEGSQQAVKSKPMDTLL
jgi:hypothetical protein